MVRVLVLYPGTVTFRSAQVAVHKPLLDALGIELVLADDYLDPSDRALFADVIELPPPTHVGEGLRRVEAWLARNAAHAVVAQSESGACLGSLVARRLGVPGLSPSGALATTSKFETRTRLARAGVPQPRFRLGVDAADVRAAAREHGYPLVLKGVASALGRLVTLVRDERGAEDAVARVRAGLLESVDVARLVDFARTASLDLGCDPTRQFLIESFATGAPLETDGVVAGGTIHTFGVTEQVLSQPPWFFMEGYLLPADVLDAERAELERISDAALRALDVGDTGFSIEMRWDRAEARVSGAASRAASRAADAASRAASVVADAASRAAIIEVNGRLGWDEGFGDMFAAVTGVQPAFAALQVALGQAVAFDRRPDLRAALAYACCYEDRVVARVPSAEELAEVARRHAVATGLAVHAGDRLHAPPHPDATPHVAYALATDAHSSRAAYARARAAVDELRFEWSRDGHGTR